MTKKCHDHIVHCNVSPQLCFWLNFYLSRPYSVYIKIYLVSIQMSLWSSGYLFSLVFVFRLILERALLTQVLHYWTLDFAERGKVLQLEDSRFTLSSEWAFFSMVSHQLPDNTKMVSSYVVSSQVTQCPHSVTINGRDQDAERLSIMVCQRHH